MGYTLGYALSSGDIAQVTDGEENIQQIPALPPPEPKVKRAKITQPKPIDDQQCATSSSQLAVHVPNKVHEKKLYP